jgi:tryptophan synthase alpha subunit
MPSLPDRWGHSAPADGVVVGSAIVRCVEEHASSPRFVTEVGDFIAALKAPLRS